MSENHIQFKKQRDLGEIISDTFRFFRENYKLLFRLIFKITGPLLLIVILAITYNTYIMGTNMGTPLLDLFTGENIGLFFISMSILLSSLLGFYTLLEAVILHFIKSYVQNKGTVIENEVYQGVKNDFGSLLGVMILTSILTIIGSVFFIIPGIYLWGFLSIAPAALIFGRTSLTNSIGKAYDLVKNNWWATFLSLLIILILMYVISFIFKVPALLYIIIKTMTQASEGSVADPAAMTDWVYIALNVIASITQYLLSSIVIVATAFIYFHLNEKKNFTGTYETISNLGAPENK